MATVMNKVLILVGGPVGAAAIDALKDHYQLVSPMRPMTEAHKARAKARVPAARTPRCTA